MSHGAPATDVDLGKLQLQSFGYFLHEANPVNGLVIDKTGSGLAREHCRDWPCVGCVPRERRARFHVA